MKLLPPVKCEECAANVEHVGCTRAKVCRLCGNAKPGGFGFIGGDRFCQGNATALHDDCLTVASEIIAEQEEQDSGEGDDTEDSEEQEGEDSEEPQEGEEGDSEGEGTEESENGSGEPTEANSEGSEGEDSESGEGDTEQGSEGDDGDSDSEAAEGQHDTDFRDPKGNTERENGRTVDTAVTYSEFDEVTDLKRILAEANKKARK